MKLTKKEREILTLINDEEVSEFLDYAQKYVPYSKGEIKNIVDKLLKLKLVEMVAVKNKKDLWYLHTKIIPEEMLDKELSYKIKYCSEPLVTTTKEKLEKKL